jgi:hypothetical protein
MKAHETPEIGDNSLKSGKSIRHIKVRRLFGGKGTGATIGHVENLVIYMDPHGRPRAGRRRWGLALAAVPVAVVVAIALVRFLPADPGAERSQQERPPPSAQAGPAASRTAAAPASPAAAAARLSISHSTITAALHSNGTYDVFGIDKAGQVIHSVMGTTTGSWGPWAAFGPAGASPGVAIAAAADSDQMLHVLAVLADGSIEQRSEQSLDQWGNWQDFAPAGTAKAIALGLDHDNLLNAFAVSPAGKLLVRKQAAPGSASWTNWAQQPLSAVAKSVAATRKVDGYLDVLVVMADGAVKWEDEDRTGFRPWVQLGLPGTAVEVSLSENASNADEIFALTANGTISNKYQEATPGHLWSDWVPDFQPCCKADSVYVGAQDGQRLSVLALGTDGTIRFVFQAAAGGPWAGGWKTFGPNEDFGV